MSRAIMQAQIEAEQHAAEAAWERATPEQQAAALEREAEIIALIDEVFGKPNLGVEDSAGLTDAEIDEELVDYIEWQDDVAFFRWGCA